MSERVTVRSYVTIGNVIAALVGIAAFALAVTDKMDKTTAAMIVGLSLAVILS